MALPLPLSSLFRRSRRLIAAFLCALGLPASSSAAAHWLYGKSPHFEMYSDESEAESRRILLALEQFRANFLRLLPLGGASEPRTTIVVFDRDSDFRAFKPLYKGKPKEVSGYFLSGPDSVTIAMTTDVPNLDADSREVIYHEYVHLLLDTRKTEIPIWLNEGLAEVFSTFKVDGAKVEYGEAKMPHVEYLRQATLWPLARLFAVTPESPDYNEDSRLGIFYAESWALTHYLMFGADPVTAKGKGKLKAERFDRFFNLVAHGNDTASSFREVYGIDLEREQWLLHDYLTGGGYYKNRSPAVAQDIAATFRPATDWERDCALLNLRWRVRGSPDAGPAAYALLKRDPSQPRPYELLAAIAANAGDGESVLNDYRKAAERGSDNPWVYVQLLQDALTAYHGATMLDARLADEQVAPWRAWASRALDLSPENHDAIELALTVEAIAAKMDFRVANRAQGLTMKMHDPARAMLALAVIHWRVNQLESARRLVALIEAQPKADMVARDTAGELRSRFPAEEAAPGPAGAAVPFGASPNFTLGLRAGRQGEAAAFLDRLLAERGTTAQWLRLDPVVARAVTEAPGGDAWQQAEERRAKALAGDADAMFDLAMAHACGAGVELSPALARDWLQKAVEHGHALPDAGFAPGPLDPAAVVTYLRGKVQAEEAGRLPPLDPDLQGRIAKAAAAADRSPPVVVYRTSPRFPKELRQTGKKGAAVVRFSIGADGHAKEIRATEYSDLPAAAAAEECVKAWRFLPTIRDGQPIGTLAAVNFTFDGRGQVPARDISSPTLGRGI